MKSTICILFAALLFATCKKDHAGPQGPMGVQGPAGPAIGPGSFSGKIRLYDRFGEPLSSIPDPVTVRIAGKTYSTTMAADGQYTLSGIPNGVHTLIFESIRFGTVQMQEIRHPGNDPMTIHQTLYLKPTYTFSNVVAKNNHPAPGAISISGNLPFSGKPMAIVAVLGNNPNPNIDDPTTYNNVFFERMDLSSGVFYITRYHELTTTTYVKVYPYNPSGSNYYDIATARRVYTAHGLPFPVTFTLTP